MDLERELTGDIKTIDLKTFINFIRSKGYDGQVNIESINEDLN